MPAVVARAAMLVVVGCCIGFASNALRPDGLRFGAYAPARVCEGPAAAVELAVARLGPDEAARLCSNPDVVVADARAAERFASGHVAGAVHLPCGATDAAVERALTLAAGRRAILVYGDSSEEARPVAEALRRRLTNPQVEVAVLDGGFPAWSAAGLACSSGLCPECAERAQR